VQSPATHLGAAGYTLSPSERANCQVGGEAAVWILEVLGRGVRSQ